MMYGKSLPKCKRMMPKILNSPLSSKACLDNAFNPATFEGAKLWVEAYLYESSDLNSTDKSQALRLRRLSDLTTVPASRVIETFLSGSNLTQWVR